MARAAGIAAIDELGLETPFALEEGQESPLERGFLEALAETPFAAEPSGESQSFAAAEPRALESGDRFAADMATIQELAVSESIADDEAPSRVEGAAAFVLGPTLRRGSSGPAVTTLQRYLAQLGFAVTADGQFGPGTERALQAFQTRAGLAADGVAGPRTKAAIAAALARGAIATPAPQPAPNGPSPQPPPSGSGRLVVSQHPLLSGHRGTPPDLILRWSAITAPGAVDFVVHFHGYSGHKAAMRIDRHKEADSGLDFVDPVNPATPGRAAPTLGVLPRGNYFGGKSGLGYDFPALVKPGALTALVQDALARASAAVGHKLDLGRLILTGHSGGGAPVAAILAHTDPDEVQIFDGTYGSGANIVRWAKKRIARELAAPSARPPALRVLYVPGTQTAPQAESIARELCAVLKPAAAARLRRLFRVDATKVAHGAIPRRFGWRLLADPAADLPDAKTRVCAGALGESGDEHEEPQASPYWQQREDPEQESTMSERQFFAADDEENFSHEHSEAERLAWLDLETFGAALQTFDAETESGALEAEPEALQADTFEHDEDEVDLERFAELEDEHDGEWETDETSVDETAAVAEHDEQSWETWAERAELAVESEGLELAASGLTDAQRKAVEITSTFETGKRGGFYGLSGNFDGQGLSFGLVNWTIGTGSLQPLLRDFAAEQPARWQAVFGPDAARFLALITPKDDAARRAQHRFAIEQMNTSMLRNGKRVWTVREPWITYFKRLAEDAEFRKIQIRYVRPLLARAEYFCKYFSLTSEASFAFMFDAVASHGKAWLTKKIRGVRRRQLLLRERLQRLEQQHGKRRIPEREKLLAIADVLGATSAPRWAAKVRARKRWFVTREHPRARELRGLEPRLDVPYAAAPSGVQRFDEAFEQRPEAFEPVSEAFGPVGEAFEPAEAPDGEDEHAPAAEITALESLLEAEAGVGSGLAERIKGVAAFVLGPTLQRGSAGPGVETLQRCLAYLGYPMPADGNFGPATEQAVRAFQTRSGLTVDGVCGPRTKAAIAAAVGGGAVPAPPGPTPVPPPAASTLADAIVRIAEQEYRRWHASGKMRETDRAAVPILQQYYKEGVNRTVSAAELQDTAWQQQHPWSAVFVSYVMRAAGAGAAFKYSAAHQGYVAAARRNRLQNVTSNPFWAYRATEVAPHVGDLVCASRSNSGATYDNIGDPQARATHCDIVTEVRPGSIRVIGGNVNQNVDAKTLRTTPDGRIALDGTQARFFAIVRCRGPIGAALQPPAPAPVPQPQPPVGKKLTPAQFVAAYAASARASQATHGVPALVTLGQAALESGWGEHAPRFNFFGIKAKASDPEHTRQLLRTREVMKDRNAKFPEIISITPRPDGKYDYIVRDWFRAYPDAAAAFDAHGRVLRLPRYAKAFTVAHDPYAFAAEIARAKYATDPSYERVLTNVMRTIEKAAGGAIAREAAYSEAAGF